MSAPHDEPGRDEPATASLPANVPDVVASPAPARPDPKLDPKLLEILVCPLTRGPLEYDAARQELVSRAARLAYPIRDGIPIMLPEEGRPLEG